MGLRTSTNGSNPQGRALVPGNAGTIRGSAPNQVQAQGGGPQSFGVPQSNFQTAAQPQAPAPAPAPGPISAQGIEFNNLSDRFLGGVSTGSGFVNQNRALARQALLSSFSKAGEEEGGDRDLLRNELRSRLEGLSGTESARKSQLENDLARQFQGQVGGLKRSLGGTGLSGSLGAGRSLGDLLGRSQREGLKGQLDLQQQGLQELGQIGGFQDALAQGNLRERQFQFQQQSALANLLQQQSASEIGRDLGFAGINGPQGGPSDLVRVGSRLFESGEKTVGSAIGAAPAFA